MTSTPLERYGLLGDTRTAALVDDRGSLDWLCLPHFDGEPVFARLVAGEDGGHFRVGPADPAQVVHRRYRPGTATLETTWQVGPARLTLTEGMVSEPRGRFPTFCLVCRLEAQGGPVQVEVHFDPRAGTTRDRPRFRRVRGAPVCVVGGTALSLTASRLDIRPGPPQEVEVAPDAPLTLALVAADREPLTFVAPDDAWSALLDDERRWREWTANIRYDGPFRPAVERSLVTLRLLTYSPSGAPVAAPTTSLPEWRGGGRNWDYRYAWPRDAAIGIGAFLGVGLGDRADAFLYWLLHAGRLDRPRLAPLLTLHGRPAPAERELDWPGYADSRPVRVGNGARGQHQLDTYGWVLDAVWLLTREGRPVFGETWRTARGFADLVARRWREPDAGIWEVRGPPAHYVHSKLMAWLALDRALRIAATRRTPPRQVRRWEAERAALGADVVTHGYDPERGTFVRAYGRRDLDAAVLVLPLLGLEPSTSPRVRGTVEAIRRELGAGGPLLHRYLPGDDGLRGREGAFLPCSFWLAQALATLGDVDEATERVGKVVELGGPLGLLSEEADPSDGTLLGNHPQALTHAALVQAALAIRDATTDAGAGPGPLRRRRAPAS